MSHDHHDAEEAAGAALRWRDALAAGAPAGAWRHLGEYMGSHGSRAEFARGADLPPDAVTRRRFLTLVGATLALAGLGGCDDGPKQRQLVAYARQPDGVVPGLPRHYATTFERDGYGVGVVALSREGRPTKIEGNAAHPASLGATSAAEQAALADLYDPARAAAIRLAGAPATWDLCVRAALAPVGGGDGDGLALLLAPTASPQVAWAVERLRARRPRARVYVHDPARPDGGAAAIARVVGGGRAALAPRFDLAAADVVVVLDADPLAEGPWALAHARAFADRRRPEQGTRARWFVAESAWTPTGTIADRRLPVRDAAIAPVAVHLAATIARDLGDGAADALAGEAARLPIDDDAAAWVAAAARACAGARGRALVIAGHRQPPAAHAAALLANALVAADGATLRFAPSAMPAFDGDLAMLSAAIDAGAVRSLVAIDGDPVYRAAGDSDLRARLARVAATWYVGAYEDATAGSCAAFAPLAHPLERWGDARAYDGTASLVQPLIAPLTGGRSAAEVIAALAGEGDEPRALLRRSWRERLGPVDLEAWLPETLKAGVVAGSALAPVDARVDAGAALALIRDAAPPPAGAFELSLRPDPRLGYGEQPNSAWLIELPAPVTTLTWGNAALIAPDDAAALGVADGDVIELDRATRVPALVVPGQARGSIALHLGWGRDAPALTAAHGVGVDAFRLRRAEAPWTRPVAIARTGERVELALTQGHWAIRGEEVARTRPLARWDARDDEPATPSLKRTLPRPGPRWAMAIDLAACTGCAACVVACQAENNVPVVGADGVRASREMHWLRVDRYFRGDARAPAVVNQPMACQHCEHAPCETVCPVAATTHSADGLNEMTYNRCVGTRFCSNNCPYKVRRFNWFDFHRGPLESGELRSLQHNPEVTVRARGVMEKCTYCVQRIRGTEAGHAPGPVVTACQQACPTRAIVFGDADDARSDVARALASPRAYAALGELGTLPRTRYLAKIVDAEPA